jgi:hypothetical protein
MGFPSLDAVFFVEGPPHFEIRDGLVHVHQDIGRVHIERVMLLSTFVLAIKLAKSAVVEYDRQGRAEVIAFPAPESDENASAH